MRLLAFTDTHEDLESLERARKKSSKADIVVCLGDISWFEQDTKGMLKRISKFDKTVLMLHGNHEFEPVLRKECELFRNIVFLHKELYEFGGYLFIAYGGGGFSLRDMEFETFIKKIEKKIKDKKVILLIHGPPFGTKTDRHPLIEGEFVGNKSYTNFIKKYSPVLVLCGHIHENEGTHDTINGSTIINPGPDGKLIQVED